MGFDLYGMNPEINGDYPKRFYDILRKWGKGDHLDWTLKIPEEVTKEYFEIQTKFDEENPGRYFRNNVWWWRPLWNFVCGSCADFLKQKDIEGGSFNDGRKISKTKAKRIASRLRKLIKDGTVAALDKNYKEEYEIAKAHNKKVEKLMDEISESCKKMHGKDLVPANYPEPWKTMWDDAYRQKDPVTDYPFCQENVENFAEFCEKSGGFEIC